MNKNLTESEVAALNHLAGAGDCALSVIGFAILEAVAQHGYRKPNPSPQGVALFAGRFVRKLIRCGFVRQAAIGYCITPAGREYVKGIAA